MLNNRLARSAAAILCAIALFCAGSGAEGVRADGNTDAYAEPATGFEMDFSQAAAISAMMESTGHAASSVELILRVGAAGFTGGAAAYPCPAPFAIDGTPYLPFRALAEAFGARVDYAAASDTRGEGLEGAFRGRVFAFEYARDVYAVGGEERPFPEKVRVTDGVTYVPARVFDDCLGTATAYDASTGKIIVRLADDGSVADLSELLGEIRETAVGNSYYGWRIDVPRKSMLVYSSFNGDEVSIYSPFRNALIEVTVIPGDSPSLEYYLQNPEELTDEFYIPGAAIVGEGEESYLETKVSDYGMAGLVRLYVGSRYAYRVSVYVFNAEYGDMDADAAVFRVGNPYTALLDSFEIRGFGEDERGIRDLTKVTDGRIEYVSYLDIPESARLLAPWKASVFPSWSVLSESGTRTLLGSGEDENLAVMICEASATDVPYRSVEELKAWQAARFSPDLYAFVDGREYGQVRQGDGESALGAGGGALPTVEITYTLTREKTAYTFIDRLVEAGDLIFHIRLMAPSRRFAGREAEYTAIVDSVSVDPRGAAEITANLQKTESWFRDFVYSDTRHTPMAVGGRVEGWASRLPGTWQYGWRYDGDSRFSTVPGMYADPLTGAQLNVVYLEDFWFPGEVGADELSALLKKYGLSEMPYDELYYELMYGDGLSVSTADAERILLGIMAGESLRGVIGDEASGEPAEVSYGGNTFSRMDYGRDQATYGYGMQYHGFPIMGEAYFLAGGAGTYVVTFETLEIYDNPANRAGLEMFLKNFKTYEASAGGGGIDGQAGESAAMSGSAEAVG